MSSQACTPEGSTLDWLSDGALSLSQSRRGYRFGLDSLLLATDLPAVDEFAVIADLGAGNGVVGLCVAKRMPQATILAVERQESLVSHLKDNVLRNGLADRVRVIFDDIRHLSVHGLAHCVGLVLCNPPYFRLGTGRASASVERESARTETDGRLADFLQAARYLLVPKGCMKLVLPPNRLSDLVNAARDLDLGVSSLRFVHPRPSAPANLMEIVLRRDEKSRMHVLAPLVVHDVSGGYTEEVAFRLRTVARESPCSRS
jgi:tRNA1Val (adenine37-N6)-methyltransferase